MYKRDDVYALRILQSDEVSERYTLKERKEIPWARKAKYSRQGFHRAFKDQGQLHF